MQQEMKIYREQSLGKSGPRHRRTLHFGELASLYKGLRKLD